MIRNIAILGATGSIGTQALDIIRSNGDSLRAHTLTAGRNYRLLIEQALEFTPKRVVIADETHLSEVRSALSGLPTEVLGGNAAIEQVVQDEEIEIVLTAMVGYAGLRPTLSAIAAGKTIALANKETLVVAGELIMPLAQKHGVRIIPVDSEHSAIYQCLVGETTQPEKILLTASGGPFRKLSASELELVTPAQALKHPNWEMGAKVTIDSASLMNKGFEMIEARWLFDLPAERIEVLVHPQSIIHSMVQMRDGSIKAQLGMPDMRLPIGYALGLGERIANDYERLDFFAHSFTFEKPDVDRFPNLTMAYEALQLGENAPCALNAANEIAVAAFLSGGISFPAISKIIRRCLESYRPTADLSLEALEETDRRIRLEARALLPHYSR